VGGEKQEAAVQAKISHEKGGTMYGWRGKIGLLVPSTNIPAEMDAHRLVPEGVSVTAGRVRFAGEVTVDTVRTHLGYLDEAADLLATAGVDVMVYGMTGGSLVKGPADDKALAEALQKRIGIPFITASTAMVEAFHSLGVRRVVCLAPYPGDFNTLLAQYFAAHDIQTVEIKTMNLKDVHQILRVTPYTQYEAVKTCHLAAADGVFLSATGWSTIDAIRLIEQDLGKPVVTAIQGGIWAALKQLGVRGRVPGFGRLLEEL
jgi:maleate isomerase